MMKIFKILLVFISLFMLQGCASKTASNKVVNQSWDELMDGKDYKAATSSNFSLDELKY